MFLCCLLDLFIIFLNMKINQGYARRDPIPLNHPIQIEDQAPIPSAVINLYPSKTTEHSHRNSIIASCISKITLCWLTRCWTKYSQS